jgi:hypothetical protein
MTKGTPMKLLLLPLLLVACADSSGATRALRSSGFTGITITGWSPMSCGKDDTTSTGFRAKNAKGDVVEGVVCCGLVFKNCTVRF